MRFLAKDKMFFVRTLLLCSLWCIVMTTTATVAAAAHEASVVVGGSEQDGRWRTALPKDTQTKKAATETTEAMAKGVTQSTIYKIKRLRTKDQTLGMQQQQQQQVQQQQNQVNTVGTTSSSSSSTMAAGNRPTRTKKQKNLSKNSHGLNKQLLNKMGFIKVKAPNSHNRKRLAVESRRHASRDDSHMFIIKLPPNLYYYTGPKSAAPTTTTTTYENSKNSLLPAAQTKLTKDVLQQQHQHHHQHQHKTTTTMHSGRTTAALETTLAAEALNANGKKVSFPFSSNGRPGRIYHWNLPILKKALDEKERFLHVPEMAKKQLLDIKDIPTWSKGKPWENETIEKPFSGNIAGGNSGNANMFVAGNKSSYKKSLKSKSPSYYAPSNAVNKNSFNKYFAGNGKPKGFYVIKENQKKPLYYKNIIS